MRKRRSERPAPAGYYSTMPSAEGPQKRSRESGEEMDEHEVRRVVRSAAESVYGVVAVVGPGWFDRLTRRLHVRASGVAVATHPRLAVTIDLHVADGVPTSQVAANVAEKVRYVVERDLGQQIAQLTVRIDGRPIAIDQRGADTATAESPRS